jgi:hypothetical protein
MPLPKAAGNLRLHPLPAGTMSAIHTGSQLSTPIVMPFPGVLRFCTVSPDTIMDDDHSFNIIKNGADTAGVGGVAADFILPDTSPASTGFQMSPDKIVEVAEGDIIYLTSNNEQTAATACWFTLILES